MFFQGLGTGNKKINLPLSRHISLAKPFMAENDSHLCASSSLFIPLPVGPFPRARLSLHLDDYG